MRMNTVKKDNVKRFEKRFLIVLVFFILLGRNKGNKTRRVEWYVIFTHFLPEYYPHLKKTKRIVRHAVNFVTI